MEDIREYDVPVHIRFCIDKQINASVWYQVTFANSCIVNCEKLPDMVDRPDYHIMAYDIETTKLPMKFPNVKID